MILVEQNDTSNLNKNARLRHALHVDKRIEYYYIIEMYGSSNNKEKLLHRVKCNRDQHKKEPYYMLINILSVMEKKVLPISNNMTYNSIASQKYINSLHQKPFIKIQRSLKNTKIIHES